ncbi:MAG: succinate dehydrogenase, hydrophobic membrane anchor protein [Alphaproteobacteria bacterium]|jgi:succinate dehydrogenase / fumarate reductase membrane anchor subunit
MTEKNLKLRSKQATVFADSSRKSGVDHWFKQRLTAVALLFLVVWAIFSLVSTYNYSLAEKIEWFKSPINAVFAIFFIIVSYFHANLGLQTIIEDYIHAKWAKFSLLIITKLLFLALAIATIFAISYINFKV